MTQTRTKIPVIYTYFSLSALAAGSYMAFINVYLYDIGLTKMEIGLFSAIAPLAAMIIQPLFAMAADRARAKNTVALILLGALAAVSALFIALNGRIVAETARSGLVSVGSRTQIAALMSLWTGIQAGLLAISNAIALEHLHELGMAERFGRARLCYSLGYAASGGVLGRLVAQNMAWIFPAAAILCLLSLLPLALMPRVSGKQAEGERIPWTGIFAYRRLIILLGFAFLLCVSNSFVYTFMPVYFIRLGGTNEMYGYSVLFMVAVETPFLLLSGRLIRRWGVQRMMLIPAACLLIRWTLVSLASSPGLIFASNLFHGGGFIVLHLTLVRYVADTVHPGLRATGQAVVSVALFSMSRAAGGLLGGWMTDTLCLRLGELDGLHWTFVINAVFVAVVGAALFLMLRTWSVNERAVTAT